MSTMQIILIVAIVVLALFLIWMFVKSHRAVTKDKPYVEEISNPRWSSETVTERRDPDRARLSSLESRTPRPTTARRKTTSETPRQDTTATDNLTTMAATNAVLFSDSGTSDRSHSHVSDHYSPSSSSSSHDSGSSSSDSSSY